MKKIPLLVVFACLVPFFSGCGNVTGPTLPNLDQMIVFGDDISDGGSGANGVFTISQGQNPPSPPYFEGRFTDGLIYSDWLYGFLAISYFPQDNNFAVAGATTSKANIITQQENGVLAQVDTYLAAHPTVPANTLFILYAGPNNFLVPGIDPNTVIPEALGDLAQAAGMLIQAGAKYIIIPTIPSYGRAPFAVGSPLQDPLDFLTVTFNTGLSQTLTSLRSQFPGVTFFEVDSFLVQFGAILHPELFGFTDVSDPCFFNGTVCDSPGQFLYWDTMHFTAVWHQALALQFYKSICADPSLFNNCRFHDQIDALQ